MKLTVGTKNDWMGTGHVALSRRERRRLGVQMKEYVLVRGKTDALPFAVARPKSSLDEEDGHGTIWLDELTQADLSIHAGDQVIVERIDPTPADGISVVTPVFSRFSSNSRKRLRTVLRGRILHPSLPTVQVGSEHTGTTPYRIRKIQPSKTVIVGEETQITFATRRAYLRLLIVGIILDLFVNVLMVLSGGPRVLFAAIDEVPLLSSVSLLTLFQHELTTLSYVLSWGMLGLLTVELMPYVLQSRRDLQASTTAVVGLAASATLFGAFLEFHIGHRIALPTAVSWLQSVPLGAVSICLVGTFIVAQGTLPSGQWNEHTPRRVLGSFGALLASFVVTYGLFVAQYVSFKRFIEDRSPGHGFGERQSETLRHHLQTTRKRLQDGPHVESEDSEATTGGVLTEFAQWTATVVSVGVLLAGIALFWPLPDILIMAAWFTLPLRRWIREEWGVFSWPTTSSQTADLSERVIPSATVCWRSPDYLVVPLFIAMGLYLMTLLTRTVLDQLMAGALGSGPELGFAILSVFGAVGLSLLFWIRIVDAIADETSRDTLSTTFVIGTTVGSGLLTGIALVGSENFSTKTIGGVVLSVGVLGVGALVLARSLSVTRLNWYYAIPVGIVFTIGISDTLPTVGKMVGPTEPWLGVVTTAGRALAGGLFDGMLLFLPMYLAPQAARSGHKRGWRGLPGWAAGIALLLLAGTLVGLLRLVVGDVTTITVLLGLMTPPLLAALVRTGMVLIEWAIPGAVIGIVASLVLSVILPADSMALQVVVGTTVISALITIGFVALLVFGGD